MSQLRTNSIVPVGGIPAGASGGGVIQLVKTSSSTQYSSSSTTYQDTISASITPRSTSNKILILATAPVLSASSAEVQAILVRGTTQICGPTKNGQSTMWGSTSLIFLDSPATTSSTTYKIQFRSHISGTTVYFGTGDVDSNNVSLHLLEISG